MTKFKNCIRLCFVPLHQHQVSIPTALHTDPLQIPELIIPMLTKLQIPIVTRQCICQPQKVFQLQDMTHHFPIHFIHRKTRKYERSIFTHFYALTSFNMPTTAQHSVVSLRAALSNFVSRFILTRFVGFGCWNMQIFVKSSKRRQ